MRTNRNRSVSDDFAMPNKRLRMVGFQQEDADPLLFAGPEHPTRLIRQVLQQLNLPNWQIVVDAASDLSDVDKWLEPLGEKEAAWNPLSERAGDGEQPCSPAYGTQWFKPNGGYLFLPKHQAVIVRWLLLNPNGQSRFQYGPFEQFILCATPSAKEYFTLLADLKKLREKPPAEPSWEIAGNLPWEDDEIPRNLNKKWDDLVLDPRLIERLDSEVVHFFSPQIKAQYQNLNLWHKRGVLLYGPQGTGKTSIIKVLGSLIPRETSAFILRPHAQFDDDQMNQVLGRVFRCKSCLFVIEDLDRLLQRINVSNLLNRLDGIDMPQKNSLVYVATTNHPDRLDPAINNRPGRFDMCLEVSNPGEALRQRYFRQFLPQFPAHFHDELAQITDGVSFAHLGEVLRMASLRVVARQEEQLGREDLVVAARLVAQSSERASRDFQESRPFGFHQEQKDE